MISASGSPVLVSNSTGIFFSASASWLRVSASRIALAFALASMIPNKVTSAMQPTAMEAPTFIACSACGEPSLQISIFMRGSSAMMPSSQQTVNQQHRSQQRQRDEGHAQPRAGEELSAGCADLRANRGAGVHHQGNQDIDVAFQCMTDGAVAGRNNDLKQIGSDGDVSRDPQKINEARHSDIARAAAQESAEKAARKRDQ